MKRMSSIPARAKQYLTYTYSASAFPPSFPYSRKDLIQEDPSADGIFYSAPRFVHHIDDHAIAALNDFYDLVLPRSRSNEGRSKLPRILDLCSSWVSHIPLSTSSKEPSVQEIGREVVGLGMNTKELANNPLLAEWVVHDLNANPDFQSAVKSTSTTHGPASAPTAAGAAGTARTDDKFDAVICNVSIDYLTRPLEVLTAVWAVLNPGGRVYLAISNRCFPTKVVKPWLSLSTNARLQLVASYFHFAGTPYQESGVDSPASLNNAGDRGNEVTFRPGDLYDEIERVDLVAPSMGPNDPLWIVTARARSLVGSAKDASP